MFYWGKGLTLGLMKMGIKLYNDYEMYDYLESETQEGYDPTIKKWVSVESEKIRSEKLRKDIQWWLQRHIKGEYTIYQVKRHINKEILNFKKEFEGLKK